MRRPCPHVAAVLVLVSLVLLAPLVLSGAAEAHPGGRRSFEREASGDTAFYLSVVAHVLRVRETTALHVEVRDAAEHALRPDVALAGWVRLVGRTDEPQPLVWEREGAGRFRTEWAPGTAGTWALEVATADAAAVFSLVVHDAAPVWVDFRPMAAHAFVAGEPGPVRFALVDAASARPVELPDDLVLHVERWDDQHERRLDRWQHPVTPTEADWLAGLDLAFAQAGAYDLWVESDSLGLHRFSQPPFDVHVEPPESTPPARPTAPAATYAFVPIAFALVAGAAVGTRFARRRA